MAHRSVSKPALDRAASQVVRPGHGSSHHPRSTVIPHQPRTGISEVVRGAHHFHLLHSGLVTTVAESSKRLRPIRCALLRGLGFANAKRLAHDQRLGCLAMG